MLKPSKKREITLESDVVGSVQEALNSKFTLFLLLVTGSTVCNAVLNGAIQSVGQGACVVTPQTLVFLVAVYTAVLSVQFVSAIKVLIYLVVIFRFRHRKCKVRRVKIQWGKISRLLWDASLLSGLEDGVTYRFTWITVPLAKGLILEVENEN